MNNYNLEYFTANESDTYSFFRIPKLLFTEKAFSSLSAEAKLLYGLMLDRMSLSFSNGWMEEDGRVFIYFSNEEAMECLGCSRGKIVRIMAELDEKDGVGLLSRKKQGQGRSTKIYVKKFVVEAAEEVVEEVPEEATEEIVKELVSKENTLPTKGVVSAIEKSKIVTSQTEKSKKETSRSSKNERLDVSNLNPNNTNKNNPESIYTHSLHPSTPFQLPTSEDDLECYILDRLLEEEKIPYEFTQHPKLMEITIRELTEYDHHLTYPQDDFWTSAFKLFNEALIQMLTDQQTLVKGATISYAKVYDKVSGFVTEGSFSSYFLRDLPEIVIEDYMTACREREIRNHLGYMKACIWSVLVVGDVGVKARVLREVG